MLYHEIILETLRDHDHALPPIPGHLLAKCDWRVLGDDWAANITTPKDAPASFDWKRVGTTGWDWQNRESMFWFFDIDHIDDHPGCGVSSEQMAEAIERLALARFTFVFKSRRGKGIQGIILAPPDTTAETQAHHRSIGQAVKKKLIEVTSIDPDHFDKFGQVGWVAADEHADDAYEVLQTASETIEFDPTDIPPPLKRTPHTDAVVGTSDNLREILDHYRGILVDAGDGQYWIHGGAFDDALAASGRERAGFPSGNTSPQEQNHVITDCGDYLYCGNFEPAGSPNRWEKCHWIIKSGEAPMKVRSFEEANEIAGGRPGKRNSYVYDTTAQAQWAATLCGGELPDTCDNRSVTLTLRKADNQVTATTQRNPDDDKWIVEQRSNLHTFKLPDCEVALDTQQEFLRCVIDEVSKERSWVSRLDLPEAALPDDAWPDCNGIAWAPICSNEIMGEMAQRGIRPDDRTILRGKLHAAPMVIGCRHFAPEYQGNFWNRYGAQYPVTPVPGDHPVTDAYLQHLGRSIQAAVSADDWCRQFCPTGDRFFFYWLMRVMKYPDSPLPMLHLCSQAQGSGKSTFIKLIRRLLPQHTVDIVLALQERHNAQLLNKLVGVIDEDDIRDFANAKQKLRRLVTGEKNAIREMRKIAVEYNNSLKLVAATNDPAFIRIDPNDRRVIVTDEIDKPDTDNPRLINQLEWELPAFLYSLLKAPEPTWYESELSLPTLTSDTKRRVMGEAPMCLADQIDAAIAASGLDAWRPKDVRPYVDWPGTDKSIETRLGNEMKGRFDRLSDGRYTFRSLA